MPCEFLKNVAVFTWVFHFLKAFQCFRTANPMLVQVKLGHELGVYVYLQPCLRDNLFSAICSNIICILKQN